MLRSPRAIEVNIAIMRIFVRLLLATHEELARRLEQLEWRQDEQGSQIRAVFETIERLIEAPADETKRRSAASVFQRRKQPTKLANLDV